MVSSCPTCQLNSPQGARRPRLAQPIQRCGTYPGEDWQMDFTQMPVSQGYKYLLVMIDTFTGWIKGFPTQIEKAEEVVKKLLHEVIPRFGLPRSLQVTMGHHLLLRSPKGSLKNWALLIISIVPGGLSLRKSRKSQPILKISNKKDNSGDLLGMEGGFTNSSPPYTHCP